MLEFVRQSSLFAELSEVAFAAISQGIREVRADRGTTLFDQDQVASHFYVVVNGWAKVFRVTPSGEEALIGVFTRGESFAEIAALSGETYPASAIAVTDIQLAELPIRTLRDAIGKDPQVALTMLSSVSRHVRRLVDEIEQMKAYSGVDRVTEFLIHLSTVDSGASIVRLPYEKSIIARKVGLKAESLSRVFARLRKYGVTIKNDMAIIDDIAVLRKRMDGEKTERRPVLRKPGG